MICFVCIVEMKIRMMRSFAANARFSVQKRKMLHKRWIRHHLCSGRRRDKLSKRHAAPGAPLPDTAEIFELENRCAFIIPDHPASVNTASRVISFRYSSNFPLYASFTRFAGCKNHRNGLEIIYFTKSKCHKST